MAREEKDRIEDLKAEDLQEVEAALASLVPRGDRIDRDRLMFLAGQRSARNGTGARRIWPACFSAMSAVAAGLLVMLLARPAPQIVERLVRVPAEAGTPAAPGFAESPRSAEYSVPGTQYMARGTEYAALTSQPLSPDSYHEVLKRVLDRGMDAWEPPVGSGAISAPPPPAKYRELLETFLESPST